MTVQSYSPSTGGKSYLGSFWLHGRTANWRGACNRPRTVLELLTARENCNPARRLQPFAHSFGVFGCTDELQRHKL